MTNKSDITTAAATLGRKGGKSTSEAKTAAARANGAKGGRPSRAFIGAGGYRCEIAKSPVKAGVWGVHLPTRSGQGDFTWHEFRSQKEAIAFCESQPDFAGWE